MKNSSLDRKCSSLTFDCLPEPLSDLIQKIIVLTTLSQPRVSGNVWGLCHVNVGSVECYKDQMYRSVSFPNRHSVKVRNSRQLPSVYRAYIA